MTSRDELLDSLKISDDERADKASSRNYTMPFLYGFIGAAVAAFIAWYFWPQPIIVEEKQETEPSDAAARIGTSDTDDNQTAQGETAPSVTIQPSLQDRAVLNASGYITARRVATVSAEITGLITDVLIEEGLMVEEGQTLAKLDDTIAKADYDLSLARIRQAEAESMRTETELAEARRELSRAEALFKDRFASEARLTQAQTSVAALEAQLKQSQANIEVAKFEAARLKERLGDYTIRAPFMGVVTVKAAQPGEIVSPISAGGGFTRTGICTIVDMASLEIEVDVNEAFIGRVKDNQEVIANLDAYPNWNIDAYVIAIIPTANRDKATVKVRIAIRKLDPRILPDMGVKVAFLKDAN